MFYEDDLMIFIEAQQVYGRVQDQEFPQKVKLTGPKQEVQAGEIKLRQLIDPQRGGYLYKKSALMTANLNQKQAQYINEQQYLSLKQKHYVEINRFQWSLYYLGTLANIERAEKELLSIMKELNDEKERKVFIDSKACIEKLKLKKWQDRLSIIAECFNIKQI